MCLASAFESLSLAAFFPVFQAVLDPAATGTPGVMGWIVALAHRLPIRDPVLAAAGLLAMIMIGKAVLLLGREVLIAHTSGRVLRDLENRALAQYAAAPCAFLIDQKQGEVVFNCLMAPAGVALLMRRFPQLVSELLKIVAIAGVLLVASLWTTLTLACLAIGIMLLTHQLSRRVAYSSGKGRTDAHAEQLSLLQEFLAGRSQISLTGTSSHWVDRLRTLAQRYAQLFSRYLVWLAIPRTVIETAVILMMLGLMAGIRVWVPAQFSASLPTVGLFGVALFQLLPSLSNLGRLRMEIDEALPHVERMHRVLTLVRPAVRKGRRRFQRLAEVIQFDQVSFRYPGRPALLTGVNLTMPQGTVTALVGPSGSGKTTVVNLLVGLYDPTAGRILIDGIPLEEYDLETWRSRVGFVSQQPFIAHATVAENIRFGRRGYSDEAVVGAARIAHADPFIRHLPRQYQTLVGERGAKLSGGQQQRIAIARAILADPDVLVFDEATSALDQASERVVQQAIGETCAHRTVLMVTHGLQMVAGADQVVTLDGGRIQEVRVPRTSEGLGAAASVVARSFEAS